MFTFAKQVGKIALSGLITLNLAASLAYAQSRPKTISKRPTFSPRVSGKPHLSAAAPGGTAVPGSIVPLPGTSPFVSGPDWQIFPGLSLGQAALNLSTLGDAFSHWPGLRPGEISQSSSNNSDNLTHTQNINDAAEILRALSEDQINAQKARLISQEVKTARIDNRYREFKVSQRIRAETPTVEDERELRGKEQRRHILTLPLDEAPSAATLNFLLDDLQKLPASGGRVPRIPLDQEMLRGIGFSPSNTSGSIELFKKGGPLHWPSVLQGSEFEAPRELIASLMTPAISQAVNGQGDSSKVAEMTAAVKQIRLQLKTKIAQIPDPEYIRAKHFLDRLDDGLTILRKPDAGAYFSGKYSAHGRTVAELVQDMTRKGLRFAPAGDDPAAYQALHQALVAYHVGSQQHHRAGDIAMQTSTPVRGAAVAPVAGPKTKGAAQKVTATAQ
jgi:hypothetical protein